VKLDWDPQIRYDITESASWEASDLNDDELSSIGKNPSLGAKRHFNQV